MLTPQQRKVIRQMETGRSLYSMKLDDQVIHYIENGTGAKSVNANTFASLKDKRIIKRGDRMKSTTRWVLRDKGSSPLGTGKRIL